MADIALLGRLLFWLGIHDFRVIDVTLGFDDAGDVEKVQCDRCGITVLR